MYDGLYGNLALSALYSMGHCRLFGEAALDLKGTPAALAGIVWSPSYNFENSLLLRAYPKEYIASHGGAYSSLSTVSNQYGAVVNLLIISPVISRSWQRAVCTVGDGGVQRRCREEQLQPAGGPEVHGSRDAPQSVVLTGGSISSEIVLAFQYARRAAEGRHSEGFVHGQPLPVARREIAGQQLESASIVLDMSRYEIRQPALLRVALEGGAIAEATRTTEISGIAVQSFLQRILYFCHLESVRNKKFA